MCVLVVHWQRIRGWPIVVGANRDELYARPSAPPALSEHGHVFAPTDLEAGGTWLGLNTDGVFAAITNRSHEMIDAGRRSRGELCRLALAESAADAAVARVRSAVDAHPRNGFNLLIADAATGFIVQGTDTTQVTPLTPGTHVLTNRHEPNAFDAGAIEAPADIDAALAELTRVCRDHQDRGDYRICKHGRRGGTVSSALVAIGETQPPRFRYAGGAPCTEPYVDMDASLSAWTPISAPRGSGS